MNLAKIAGKIGLVYHSNMLDINRVLNAFGLRSDEKAEEKGKYHTFKCFDCMELMGLKAYEFLEKEENEG